MNESLEASAVALHSVAKVLHSQYRATVAAYPANKRQTKIPVTALKAQSSRPMPSAIGLQRTTNDFGARDGLPAFDAVDGAHSAASSVP
jgi:hypothetical protein